ncbi:hypothetical protein [Hydrogenophaga sp. NFH-34]|uniref:hypothetical protein n=1 Tax=Hydrogenophaga sp. NFH-34 TaxID=2744446 RepID=UPI001F3E4EEE|nr:hypothetical protein [Hydrogenophaga sp. NFH-34]
MQNPRIEELEAEVAEQARLLGMSAERELALVAQVERLQEGFARLRADRERLNWLDQNIFHCEPDDFERKHGACKDGKTNKWALYAPAGIQGSARVIIDAARST